MGRNRDDIRRSVLLARNSLDGNIVAKKSSIIIKKIIESGIYQKANSLMVYVNFNNEVQTTELISRALEDGKSVSVPITKVKEKKLIPSRLLNYPEDLTPGVWGIMEPKANCVRPVDPKELDLIVVPGVSFDDKGNRLGYGAGYYDRFLIRTKEKAVFVAPCFELQMTDSVFPDDHDVPVHFLFTEERTIKTPQSIWFENEEVCSDDV